MKNTGKYEQLRSSSFTGKERDSETGFSYFGARYYDSDLSGLFLSIDPMADKYPNLSPYAYCAWNPLKLVDPDGNEVEYSSIKDWIIVSIARTFNKDFRIRFNDLKSSEETYLFKNYRKENGKGGEVTTDGEKIIINYNTWSNKYQGSNAFVNLEHETEHAIQFEYGEVGFDKTTSNSDSWNGSVVNMDLYDEVAARDIGYGGYNFNPNADNVRNSWLGSTEEKANHLSKQNAYKNLPKENKNNQNEVKIKDNNRYMLPHRTRPNKY